MKLEDLGKRVLRMTEAGRMYLFREKLRSSHFQNMQDLLELPMMDADASNLGQMSADQLSKGVA